MATTVTRPNSPAAMRPDFVRSSLVISLRKTARTSRRQLGNCELKRRQPPFQVFVGGHDEHAALSLLVADSLDQLAALFVQACARLVQEQDFWFVLNGEGEF